MTLIVGIRCQDAVVVASDSAATFGNNLGQVTVAQPTDKKIQIIEERVILGVSGPVGLGQRFRGELTQLARDNKRLKGESWQIMTEIRMALLPHIKIEFEAAAVSAPIIGQGAANSAISTSIIALASKSGPTLFQFDPQGAPEESTEQLPFICVGSGQILADPFIAFVKDVFWERGKFPTLNEGLFAATWTLRQAIAVAPGGIGGDVHVATLAGDGQRYVARELDQSELGEHFQAIDDAKVALRGYRTFGAAAPPPPLADELPSLLETSK